VTTMKIDVRGSEAVLLCPKCDFSYIKITKTELFNRKAEDDLSGLHVSIEGISLRVDDSLIGNPSDRRSGMYIYFECENCPEVSRLSLSQHKGETFLSFT